MNILLLVTTSLFSTLAVVALVYSAPSLEPLYDALNQTLTLNASLSSTVVMDTLSLISYENFTNDIAELQDKANELYQQMTQKTIEILQLQIQANQTGEPGAIVRTVYNTAIAHNTDITFAVEYWDDANYWSLGNATKFYIPSDGRYALGFELTQYIFHPWNSHVYNIQLRLNNDTNFKTLNSAYVASATYPDIGYARNSYYDYYEQPLLKQNNNYITARLLVAVPGGTPYTYFTVNCTFSIQRIGNLTQGGIQIGV